MSNTQITNTQSKKPTLKSLINGDDFKNEIAKSLPKHLPAERFVRIAVTALTRVPKLAECDPASFCKALIDLSAVGLEPDGRRAHLIPFENRRAGIVECQLIIDYKGIVELVRRDRDVVDVHCYTIRENDDVIVKNGIIEHSYNPARERGKVMAVYTRIDWANGHIGYGEPMQRDEMESVRDRSMAWQSWLKYKKEGPWNTNESEMWKKTAIRRDSKLWPLSPEIEQSLQAADRTEFDFSKAIKPAERIDDFEMPSDPFEGRRIDNKQSEEPVAESEPEQQAGEGELL